MFFVGLQLAGFAVTIVLYTFSLHRHTNVLVGSNLIWFFFAWPILLLLWAAVLIILCLTVSFRFITGQ